MNNEQKLFKYIDTLSISVDENRKLTWLIDIIMNESYQIGWNNAKEDKGDDKFDIENNISKFMPFEQ